MCYSEEKYNSLGRQVVEGKFISKNRMLIDIMLALLAGFFLGGAFLPMHEYTEIKQNNYTEKVESAVSQQIIYQMEILINNPYKVDIWVKLGDLYYGIGEIKKSVNFYEKGLLLEPNKMNVLSKCGRIYRSMDQNDKALIHFDHVLALDPAHETAFFHKEAIYYFGLNKKSEGVKIWNKFLRQMHDLKRLMTGYSLPCCRNWRNDGRPGVSFYCKHCLPFATPCSIFYALLPFRSQHDKITWITGNQTKSYTGQIAIF